MTTIRNNDVAGSIAWKAVILIIGLQMLHMYLDNKKITIKTMLPNLNHKKEAKPGG